jgi:proteasome assembly chaperone (PAC2) family protein
METVLVVCADADRCAEIVGKLHDEGAAVVGTAHTAGLALALTAQTGPRSAILVGETAGRRTAGELAEALADTWGVQCIVIDDESSAGAAESVAGGSVADRLEA